LSPSRKQGVCDAKKIKQIGRSDAVLSAFLGVVSVDAQDQELAGPKGGGEVGDVRGFVLAAKEDVAFGNLAATSGGKSLLAKELNALSGVMNRKRILEDFAVAIAAKRHVLFLGEIESDAENFASGNSIKNLL